MPDYVLSQEDIDALKSRLGNAADRMDGLADILTAARTPSKAHLIGGGTPSRRLGYGQEDDGAFLKAVMQARSRDTEEQAIGKATLEGMSRYVSADEIGAKATLAATDLTGGWIVPNPLLDELVKPEFYANPYRALCTIREGVNTFAVDIPFRSSMANRAVIAAFGATKENVDLAYNGYTATMYTLARIHDIGNQFLRQSQGAAQADVLGELGSAIALGEAWYILNGTGTLMPYGVITALTQSGLTAYTSTFTASSTTLAGSVLSGLAVAAGALAARNRVTGITAVVGSTTYGTMLAEGTDTAGFFLNGAQGAASLPGFALGTLVSPWGIPVIPDSSITDKSMIVGQWKALKVYFGQGFRVDSSDVAGTRWDSNVTGFRGEEELGLDARPAVYAGAFQQITSVVP